jgi:hypothetical protein
LAHEGTFNSKACWYNATSVNIMQVERSQVWPIGASVAKNKNLKKIWNRGYRRHDYSRRRQQSTGTEARTPTRYEQDVDF